MKGESQAPLPEKSSLVKRVSDIERVQGSLRRQVSSISSLISTRENASIELAQWLGRTVTVVGLRQDYWGKLLWVDRYHVALQEPDLDEPTILSKGSIEAIRPAGENARREKDGGTCRAASHR